MKPKIRLKGFDGEWDKKIMGDLGTTYSGLSGKSKTDFGNGNALYITFLNVLTNAIIDTSSFQNVDVRKGERQNEVKKGDLLFNTSSETPSEVGMCSVMGEEIPNLYLNSFCFGFRLNDRSIDSLFFAYLMRSPIGRRLMTLLAQGATRYNLSKSILYKAELQFPQTISEQQSIANYFKSLDELIQSTTQKVASLKQLKEASLISMFPQGNETTPRVRFKGFEGKWEIKSLSCFSKKVITKNANLKYKITLTNSADYGIINQLDFFDHDISNEDNTKGYYVVENDDFVYNPRISSNAPVGPINRNQLGYTGVMSPLYYVFRVDGINKDFLSWYFSTNLWHKFMKDNGNSGARYDRLSITDEVFVQMPITFPSNIHEQQHIASYFNALDTQITLQEQRLEKLKQLKSACLDQMFV